MRSPVDFAFDDGSPPPAPPACGRGDYVRIVIGVDPPAGTGGDACGIVAVGKGRDGSAYVLADHSVKGRSPEGWARAVAAAALAWGADRVTLLPEFARKPILRC